MGYIYLDNSATTKPSLASLTKMREALSVSYGNPSSAHKAGSDARQLISDARQAVSSALGLRRLGENKIIFTSGGTEANNLALLGTVYAKSRPEKGGTRGKILIGAGEHSSVAQAAKKLSCDGFTVLFIPTVGGVLDLDFISENADSSVILASFMLVNNETGALYDVKSAASIIRAASPRAVIHTDAVQAFLKTKFSPAALGVDLISVSSHKIFAPKGAGALYISGEIIKRKAISPIVHGGGQEDGLRSGTENVPAIAAFGAAANEGARDFDIRYKALQALREVLTSALCDTEVRINTPPAHIPGIINLTLPGIRSEIMLNFLSGLNICISAGSACSTHAAGPSGALLAYGMPTDEADCSVRVSTSYENTEAEMLILADAIKKGLSTLKRK